MKLKNGAFQCKPFLSDKNTVRWLRKNTVGWLRKNTVGWLRKKHSGVVKKKKNLGDVKLRVNYFEMRK